MENFLYFTMLAVWVGGIAEYFYTRNLWRKVAVLERDLQHMRVAYNKELGEVRAKLEYTRELLDLAAADNARFEKLLRASNAERRQGERRAS